jgi:predicted RecB family nuclease
MLRSATDALVLSATDLTNHLACTHLTGERHRLALGLRPRPRPTDDAHADLIRLRGQRHEEEQLAFLVAEAGGDWADLRRGDETAAPSLEEIAALADRTAAAMRLGTRLIYQATFLDDRWQGRADFLRRVDGHPSSLGLFSYEVLDTKLARQVKPHVVHQLCLYNRLAGVVQGVELDRAGVILGDGTLELVELSRYRALHRRAVRRLEQVLERSPVESYPEPTAHCPICRLQAECDGRRRDDDHLSLVAGARRDQRRKLVTADIARLAELAEAPEELRVEGLDPERFSLLHHQAALQLNARRGVEPVRRHLAPAWERGYARLPEPSAGDVFFDLEGDPYLTHDGGIEYLWGWSTAEGYECLWAQDERGERAALEGFVGMVEERRLRHPDLHVFHYAAHEASKLRSLALKYATCETIIDDWLRRGVLVDLYAVVRQALQVGEESYSLKKLEPHHAFVREETTVREGGGSIVAYETWLETHDPSLLDAIRDYNREDCESTASLFAWLRDRMRPEAADLLGVDFDDLTEPPKETFPAPEWLPETEELIGRLHAGLPADPAANDPDQAERRMLGHLLLYHHRENKPQYWAFFELCTKTPEELVEEAEAVGLIELDHEVEPVLAAQSFHWTYRFPEQEAKLSPGTVVDPVTGAHHALVRISDGQLVLSRQKKKPAPTPRALIGGTPPNPAPLRKAIEAIAEPVLAGERRFPGIRALLRGEEPRLSGSRLGPLLGDLVAATLGLDGSYLAVQGPAGTGKTYNGARMAVAALRAGRRVALTAGSHAAIQNFLRAAEDATSKVGFSFAGVYKGTESLPYHSPHGFVEEVGSNEDTRGHQFQLVAGTPWLLARDEHAEAFDLLFIDEAGQLALAGAVAAGRCATSLVLLGDPQQLPQVNQASHPGGSDASVLGHVLAGEDVIRPDRGVLLDVSWRMHPDVCRFVSERSYGGILRSRPECERRSISASGPLDGSGLRLIEVEHTGRRQDAPEEALAIAAACRQLLSCGATVTDDEGATRDLRPDDVLVVAPYNLAVARIRRAVPAGVRVGTVDRFQGQEAPVVFFAMTCSSGEDVPRGLDFLFDRNRLNVAVSRAQCLAVLVHAPRLLDADCRTIGQMALVDGPCRFTELASYAMDASDGMP